MLKAEPEAFPSHNEFSPARSSHRRGFRFKEAPSKTISYLQKLLATP